MSSTNLIRTDVIHVDVIGDKDGSNRARSLGSASILGMFTHDLDARLSSEGHSGGFHVDVEAGVTYVRDVSSGATIIKGRGFAKTMQLLADTYGVPVVVGHDPGASSSIKDGEYLPSVPVEAALIGEVEEIDMYAVQEAEAEARYADARSRETALIEAAPVAGDSQDVEASPVEVEHAFGRASMLCGVSFEAGKGTTRMLYVTCPQCRSALVVKTANGVEVADGLAVFDYDLNLGRVALATMDSDGWFHVVKADGSWSLMNGERVVTRHNGVSAEDALNARKAAMVAPVPVFEAVTQAEVEALDATFGEVKAECVCEDYIRAGAQFTDRTCEGCGSFFPGVARVEVAPGDTFEDVNSGTVITVESATFIGADEVLFSLQDGRLWRVPALLVAVKVRDGELIKVTDPCVHCGGSASAGWDDRIMPFPHECITRADLDKFKARAGCMWIEAAPVEVSAGDRFIRADQAGDVIEVRGHEVAVKWNTGRIEVCGARHLVKIGFSIMRAAEVWAGTGTLVAESAPVARIKRPIRTNLVRRARKAAARKAGK